MIEIFGKLMRKKQEITVNCEDVKKIAKFWWKMQFFDVFVAQPGGEPLLDLLQR